MNEQTDADDLEHGRRDRQFDAMVEIFCTRYGVKKDEIPQILENARWAAQHRSNLSRISWHITLGALGSFVIGLLMLTWEGIKLTITKGP
jgi:hypothetical protein